MSDESGEAPQHGELNEGEADECVSGELKRTFHAPNTIRRLSASLIAAFDGWSPNTLHQLEAVRRLTLRKLHLPSKAIKSSYR